MKGRAENILDIADFHQLTAKQHADPVGQASDHRKVVRNEQHGKIVLTPQPLQQ